MAMWEFPCSEPIDANISLASGSVSVRAEPVAGDVIRVRVLRGRSADAARAAGDDQAVDDVTVDFADRHLVVSEESRRGFGWRNKELHVAIWMPAGSRLAVQAASAEVSCRGEYGAIEIHTASGRVDVQTVQGPVEITAMSGDVSVIRAGESSIQTASGQIVVRIATGDVMARTASGAIRVGEAHASVTARTASGRIFVGSLAHGRADLHTVSGDIQVNVAQGTGVFLDLASVTGQVSSDLTASDQQGEADLQLQCRTVSGSLHVARAASAETPA
jgi:putative adhesin